ncbi:MAG: peptidyl-prolyl cis-trans isomerase [Acidobacteriota bacterium]
MRHQTPSSSLPAWLTLLVLAAAGPAVAQEPLNHIVLRVNDQILTLYDYESRKDAEIRTLLADTRLSPAERKEALSAAGRTVMQQIFREMLLESFSRQNGITVSEREIDDSIQQVQERQGMSTTDELLQALEASGMTLQDLRDSLRGELLLSSVIRREVTAQIEVGDDELRGFYRSNPELFQVQEERRLRELIVLEDSGLGTEELLAKAQEIHRRLEGGESMEEVAATYRDDGVSTGVVNLDWLQRKDLEETLSEAAFAAPEGGYTPPVQARGGYHVVHVMEVKEGFVRPFEEVEEQIQARERQRRFGSELQKFMTRLETTSFIQENLPADAIGYRTLATSFETDSELEDFRAPVLSSESGSAGEGPGNAASGDAEGS